MNIEIVILLCLFMFGVVEIVLIGKLYPICSQKIDTILRIAPLAVCGSCDDTVVPTIYLESVLQNHFRNIFVLLSTITFMICFLCLLGGTTGVDSNINIVICFVCVEIIESVILLATIS